MLKELYKPKEKQYPIPFDTKLSRDLDRAVQLKEDGDHVQRILGTAWKRKIEKKVFGD